MATGKTTIGQRLAARLNRPFFDLDALICARAGRGITAIFAAEGEEGFRRWERAAFEGLEPACPAVIALGGGAVTQASIRAALPQGVWISLRARLETLRARLSEAGGDRPLSRAEESLEALYARRAPFEEGAALTLHVDKGSPSALTAQIIEALCAL
ncbi:shikimate kinase AroK [Myxococcota bacterium]|nr:shikimate kinase AroK [Myxococcota bacterium]MBU1429342.1 shikimate kinase AroK [Myxococcota bacterium]MBU1899600.1 shikimate kinase AroK [Myxococcota bacterium]